jgi:hypothetical protein
MAKALPTLECVVGSKKSNIRLVARQETRWETLNFSSNDMDIRIQPNWTYSCCIMVWYVGCHSIDLGARV